jgi:peptide/nickel transport system substrate-binding protein
MAVFPGLVILLILFIISGQANGKNIKELRIGIGIDPDTLNPLEHTTAVPFNISELIHDTLFRVDAEGKLVPLLAEKYSVSKDGLTWTVNLRKGIQFSDGSPLNAHALKAHFDALLNPKLRVPLRFIWGSLKETNVIDDLSIQLPLKAPFAPFDQTLALVCPQPQKVLEQYDADKMRQSPIGAGPFKIVQWVKGERIVLVPNEKYWGKRPTVDRLVYQIIPDTTTRITMLRAGQIDIAYSPTPADIQSLETDSKIKVDRPLSPRIIFVGMNCQKGYLRDKRVRQAFNYGVDKNAIARKIMFNVVKPLDAPMSPILFGHNPMENRFEYDPAKAKALLKEAGFPKDAAVKMITPTGRYTYDKQVTEAIQAYLMDIGVNLEVRTYDWPTYMAMVTKPHEQSELELFLFGWGPPYLDADFALFMYFSSYVQPPKGLGSCFYTNPEFDKTTAMARQVLDQVKRRTLYKEAATMLWEDAPAIWLYVEPYSIAYRSDIRGLVTLPMERMYPAIATRD